MTLVASNFLGGAKSRLLPASIPFRYFGAAAIFHLIFWVALFLGAEDLPRYGGGQGPLLAAIHSLTLGVLAMTAMGAAFQLLPVATKAPLRAVWPTRLASWLMIPGVALLVLGMGTAHHEAQALGAAAAVLGLAIFAVLVADNLRRTSGMVLVTGNAWGAVASLVAVLGLGFALIVDQEHGLFEHHGRVAATHMILAVYGFMGLLAMGFSYILVPMFALSPAPDVGLGRTSLAFCVGGVAVAASGALAGSTPLGALGGALGFVGIVLHLRLMTEVMAKRMRKQLGPSFVLVRLGWAFLPLSALLGIAAASDLVPRAATFFGAAALMGWLLTFVMGILQRIVPFLASMHAAKTGRAPPLVSALTPEAPLKVHFWCHVGALASIGLGLVLDEVLILRLGAAVGAAGAVAFLAFFVMVLVRLKAQGGGVKP